MPSLTNNTAALREQDVKVFIGTPVQQQMPLSEAQADGDVVTPFFRCPPTPESQEVHGMAYTNRTTPPSLNVAYGGRAPAYKEERLIEVTDDDTKTVEYLQVVGQKVSLGWGGTVFQNCLFCNSNKNIEMSFPNKRGKVTTVKNNGLKTVNTTFNIPATESLVSFDANLRETTFIILSEDTENSAQGEATQQGASAVTAQSALGASSNTRKVHMYLRDKPDPVCSYIPPQQPFLPTSVCFFHINDQEVLLVSDMATDTIHVVDVANNQFRFIRYLAHFCW
jgi:hypothetical protein